ncbi:MAG TPA: hypothetical protein VJ925_07350 [Longimicrobiales bacterium]|nr:hypothetical protein [Longimicrobiales bacterium]
MRRARGSRNDALRSTVGAVCLAAATAALITACGESPLEPLEAVPEARLVTDDGYEITVTVTPARAARGDTVLISSRVVRVGETAGTAWLRTCELDIETARDFPDPSGTCFALGGERTLMPGDTVLEAQAGVVDWPRGEHPIRVRHMVQPSRWLEVTLAVE